MAIKFRKKAKLARAKLTPEQNQQAAPDYVGFDELTPHQLEIRQKCPPVAYVVLIMGAIMLFSGLADDAFVPALNAMSDYFTTPIHNIQTLVPVFFAGLGIGQFIWGPYVDRFGRRSLVIVCSLLAIASNFWIVSVGSFEQVVIARFFQGIIYSGLATAPQIVVKDISSPRDFIILNSWVIMIFLLAPATSPMIGGWILYISDWKWIFHVISITVGLCMIVFMYFIPETIDPLRKQPLNTKRILNNYKVILKNKRSTLIIAITCIYGIMIWSFPTLIPAVLLEDYHISPQHIGYYIFFTVLVVVAGIFVNNFLVKKGFSPAKIWLYASIIQTILLLSNLAVSFQWFGVQLTLFNCMLVVCLNVFFNNFLLPNMAGIYVMEYSHMTGTATSLITALRLLIPGVVVSFFAYFPRNMGQTVLLINASLIFICCLLTILFHLKYSVEKKPVTIASTTRDAEKEAELEQELDIEHR